MTDDGSDDDVVVRARMAGDELDDERAQRLDARRR
jgi:hypothetical protein